MKEFAITDRKNEQLTKRGFSCIHDAFFLYYEEDLCLLDITGQITGRKYYLLGYAIQTDSSAPNPAIVLQQEKFENIEEVMASWSGRWALVTPCSVYNDALNLMRLFYAQTAECFFISNSMRLFSECLTGLNFRKNFSSNSICKGLSIDYYPGPGTIFKEVDSTLYMHHLDMEKGCHLVKSGGGV